MHCRKCDCFFPDSEKLCPVCKNDKAEGKFSNYTSLALGGFVFFLFGCFFNPGISFLIVLFILIPCILLTNKEYREASKNNGFYFTEKTLKFKKKNNPTPTTIHSSLKRPFITPTSDSADIIHKSALDEFKDNLSIVWTDADSDDSVLIEFSYRGFNDELSRRSIILNEVSVNQYSEIYFTGYCLESSGERTFKLSRVTSKVKFNGKNYGKDDFIDDVLFLDSSEFS